MFPIDNTKAKANKKKENRLSNSVLYKMTIVKYVFACTLKQIT